MSGQASQRGQRVDDVFLGKLERREVEPMYGQARLRGERVHNVRLGKSERREG